MTDVRIDGSERASGIAGKVHGDLIYYTSKSYRCRTRLLAEHLRTLISALKQAEDEIVQAARDDFGG